MRKKCTSIAVLRKNLKCVGTPWAQLGANNFALCAKLWIFKIGLIVSGKSANNDFMAERISDSYSGLNSISAIQSDKTTVLL